MEGDGEDESAACGRNWAELQRDALVVIFLKLGSMEVLRVAGSVCRSWRRVSKEEPGLWRRIDMTNHNYGSDAFLLSNPTKLAIDLSGGLLEEFSVEYFGDDDLLQYLCERTSVLKKLSLISCYQLSDETLAETARKQPRLEELQIIFRSFSENVTEILGKECPQLKSFKFNNMWYNVPPSDPDDNDEVFDDDEALGIAKTMHQLCHLQLIGNRLTNKGLKAILDGCPHLETLDIRRCYNVNMDADMQALCSRLKTIRLPGDSVEDYDFQADADHECCSDEDDFYHDLDLDLDYDYDDDDDYENYLLDLDDIFDDDEEDDDDDEIDYTY